MPNYNNSIVYKLCCKDVSVHEIYIGSTTDFTKRKSVHRHCCNNENSKQYNSHCYRFIRDNGGFDNWSMIQICVFDCENKRELETEERRYIELLGAKLNSNIPTRGKICEHGIHRQFCKECNGSAICEHGKRKTQCKKCNGTAICEHGRHKPQCKECGGSAICEHGRHKPTCKECGGSAICEHGKMKPTCKECGGSAICEHGKMKPTCKECGGSAICEHGRHKPICKECGGSAICEHGKMKARCKECGGSAICEHGRHKPTCKECNPLTCPFCTKIYTMGSIKSHLKKCIPPNKQPRDEIVDCILKKEF